MASNHLVVTCLTVKGIMVNLGSQCVLVVGSCVVNSVLLCKSLPCSRLQRRGLTLGPDSSPDPGLDRGFLELLPLEVADAADDLKSNQVEVANLWSVWGFWRS